MKVPRQGASVLQKPKSPETFDAERSALAKWIVAAMHASDLGDMEFNELALAVFRHQLRWNVTYARFVQSQGGEAVRHWTGIPAVSTDVFKWESVPVVCGSAEAAPHRFRTSGTTGELRGTHFFHSLDVYEASIEIAWRRLGLPQLPMYAVTLAPEDWPESSLGHMVGVLQRMLPEGGGCFIQKDGQLRADSLWNSLHSLPANQPVLVLGTALAFLNWFEQMDTGSGPPLTLPPGSAVMETGGYKGTGRGLAKSALYQLFESHLGVPTDRIINEYSMTELSSQFYSEGIGRAHRGPSWARARVIDPETRAEVSVGERGYVEIVDLANVDSVLAIQTRDLAVRREGGYFELIGRDPAALPRGCSRAADELIRNAQ
ncbi:MAG: hypothetical protein O3C21_05250 [Verrucomicrobia bacterium]|nr:hypothetical protein [Verrucomicrobiota bacterium]